MKTYRSESTVRPVEWDTESSKTTVYHNQFIDEYEKDGTTFYSYNVTEYTKEEYNTYLSLVNGNDITTLQQSIVYLFELISTKGDN